MLITCAQQIACVEQKTGDCRERRRVTESGQDKQFYRELKKKGGVRAIRARSFARTDSPWENNESSVAFGASYIMRARQVHLIA